MRDALRIARHDFVSVRRSRLLWGVIGVYALFTVLLIASQNASDITNATELLVGVTGVTAVVLPVVAIVAGYLAIAGERESGTIKVRLGLPDSRFALVLGKLVSRGATVALGVGVAFGVALGLAIALYGSLNVGVFARFAVISGLFAVTNAAIAVGLSALASSRARAMSLGVGFYVCGNVLWMVGSAYLVAAVRSLASLGGLTISGRETGFVTALSPMGAYLEAMELAFVSEFSVSATGALPWFGLAVFAVWAVSVPAAGYWRFRRAELA